MRLTYAGKSTQNDVVNELSTVIRLIDQVEQNIRTQKGIALETFIPFLRDRREKYEQVRKRIISIR